MRLRVFERHCQRHECLDSATAAEVLDAVTRLARQLKLTLVMVTHDPATAARADRRLGLKDGRLITENGTLV